MVLCRSTFGFVLKLPHRPNVYPAASARPTTMLPTRRTFMTIPRISVCTLDCTGTIMEVKGSLPRLYLEVLEDELGIAKGAMPGVSEQALLESFGKSMKQRSRELPCFGASVISSEEWWAEVVRDSFIGAGVNQSELDGVFDTVFDKLFSEVFAGRPAWELVPGAREVIDQLRSWCRGNSNDGPSALGVISNFDERLHALLKDLGVHDAFDFVLTSRECASEKPDPLMFKQALERAGASEGSIGVHIGDNFKRDVLGARGVEWHSILITDQEPTEPERAVDHIRVPELKLVPQVLGISQQKMKATRIDF